jgi:hypothetical protein
MNIKGKSLTLGAKLIGAMIALGGLAAKIWIDHELDIDSVLKVAAFVPLLFTPVDLSLIAENVFGWKLGRSGTSRPGSGEGA